jgi:hypothetical protein
MEKSKEYHDPYVRVDAEGITIYCYYFPTRASSKTVPWKNLTEYESYDISDLIPMVDYKQWGNLVFCLYLFNRNGCR